MEKCIIPELHILQGFCNHLFWAGIASLVGRDKALLWPRKLNLISRDYHGECFEGNACRTHLKEAELLNDPKIYHSVGYFAILPFISAFKNMNKIVEKYSVTKKITDFDDLPFLLRQLEIDLKNTNVSFSLKLHVFLNHSPQCLQFLNNDGLGLWSEQAGESIHRKFKQIYENYKINSIANARYAENLRAAVVVFSSLNI